MLFADLFNRPRKNWREPRFVRGGSWLHYDDNVAKLIYATKYFEQAELGTFLGRQAALEWQRSGFFDGIDLLVPVPIHQRRIDIKIVGARKGERLIEPLWLKEENPTPTKYKKLLRLDNKEYESERLERLLTELRPICFWTEGQEEKFRDKTLLVKLLCDDCESLRDFYEEIKNDNQLRTDLL